MARYQYRYAGRLGWMSSSGSAILVLQNKAGSGKKVTVRSLEVYNLTATNTATAGNVAVAPAAFVTLARATLSGGDPLSAPVAMDSAAGAWPASISVLTSAGAVATATLMNIALSKQLNATALSWMGMQTTVGSMSGVKGAARPESGVTGIVLASGESLALVSSLASHQSFPLKVEATLIVNGRSWFGSWLVHSLAPNVAFLGITNGSASSVQVHSVRVMEVGTYDSPYYQVVPAGALNAGAVSDPTRAVPALKMDSSYPSASTYIGAYSDMPILPFGLPDNAISDGSAGSPKGYNYLKTRDFLGPVYRAFLPEYVGADQRAVIPDMLGTQISHHMGDVGMRRAGVVLREGEAIAIVSGAETATIATAVGTSGWSLWEFAAQIDVEPSISPTLSVTGLKPGSEVRIFAAGTTNQVAGQESVSSGSFSWLFDPEVNPSVDISILALGYQNIRLTSVALALADKEIPVQQQVDRQYGNP